MGPLLIFHRCMNVEFITTERKVAPIVVTSYYWGIENGQLPDLPPGATSSNHGSVSERGHSSFERGIRQRVEATTV